VARVLPISDVKTRLPELVTGVEGREEEIDRSRAVLSGGGCELSFEELFGEPLPPPKSRRRK
jgi:hypothetical protein